MDVDHGISKWKATGYVVGCFGIGIISIYFDGKLADTYKFILIGKLRVPFQYVLLQTHVTHAYTIEIHADSVRFHSAQKTSS